MYELFSPLIGAVLGGGVTWFFTIRAMRRKANGEATLSEADGWKAMQDVYQQTIADLKTYCAEIKKDRDALREENAELRKSNLKWHERYNEIGEEILELKKQLARQGRQIGALRPFTCAIAGCTKRTEVDLQEIDEE